MEDVSSSSYLDLLVLVTTVVMGGGFHSLSFLDASSSSSIAE